MLHRNCLFVALWILCTTSTVSAQTYFTGVSSITFNDPSRGNRPILCDLYYPSATGGNSAPLAPGSALFPVVVYGHGFSIGTTSYRRLADSLVRYGYIVALPTTESGLLPSHDNFGKDLAFAASALIALNSSPTSPFFQRIKPRAALGGHSMGGGCSFLGTAAGSADLFALFNMAAAETNPSSTAAAAAINIPTLIYSGSNDCIVPPSTQLGMYNNLLSSCKTVINITGATHCQFAANNGTCVFGQITSGCNSSPITLTSLYTLITQSLIPFLDYQLKDSCSRGIDYVTTYNSLSGITGLNTCPVPACSIVPLDFEHLGYIRDAAGLRLRWTIRQPSPDAVFHVEKSADGRDFNRVASQGAQGLASAYQHLDTDPWPRAFYRIRGISRSGREILSETLQVTSAVDAIPKTLWIYPQPVRQVLHLRIWSATAGRAQVRISDATGRSLRIESVILTPGYNVYTSETGIRQSGLYLLTVSRPDGSQSTERLMIQGD